jgi:sulfite exporter TauE/SafE
MTFKVVTDVAFFGLGPLAYVLGGIWWAGVGSLLRPEKPALAVVTIVLGVATLASGLGYLLQVDLLARLINFLLSPVWALWLGVMVATARQQEAPPRLLRES